MLKRLSCARFRNLETLDWPPGPGSHLLVGPNGAGKTSLLEAVYVLATTRSFRTGQIADCCRHGQDGFQLHGEVEGERRADLELGWDRSEGRRRALNAKPASLAEHLGVLPVVSWSSADGEVVSGAPEARRRLLDQGVVGLRPAAVEVIARYRQALGQKRELLLRQQAGLEAWNQVLAEAAAELIGLRRLFVGRLEEELTAGLCASGLGLAGIELRYLPSPAEGEAGAPALVRRLEALRGREVERRQPLIGPHRDELEIRLAGHDVRRIASAGERKAIGLLLAAARWSVLTAAGREPVLLVDDADAELDPGRLEAVWKVLARGRQVLATSSRPEAWRRLDIDHCWRVAAGTVAAAGSAG